MLYNILSLCEICCCHSMTPTYCNDNIAIIINQITPQSIRIMTPILYSQNLSLGPS